MDGRDARVEFFHPTRFTGRRDDIAIGRDLESRISVDPGRLEQRPIEN